MKMKDRNSQLKASLQKMPGSKANLKAAYKIPDEDTANIQGHKAYKIEDTLRLISMLNTLKLEPQFYRSESTQMKELQELIEKVVLAEGPYFVCQAIVWSRCLGEGMRSINHLAAALVAPFICGEPYAQRFYGLWDKKAKKGGCIFRPDDMSEIKDAYTILNQRAPDVVFGTGDTVFAKMIGPKLSNAMKKGFKAALEKMDAYSLFKYKKTLVDIANLVHPAARNSVAEVTLENGEKMSAIIAMMTGKNAKADTWEVAQSEAGQIVAQAVREGKLSEEKAKEVLKEAKSDNWKTLLEDNKLGILAALRNLRNMLEVADPEVIDKVAALVSDPIKLRQGKIMPYQIDLAYEAIRWNTQTVATRKLVKSLEDGIERSVSNLTEKLSGRNLVIVDCSGSMSSGISKDGKRGEYGSWYAKDRTYTSCSEKAGLIAAMIAKATNADIIQFGSRAQWYHYNPNDSVFTLAYNIQNENMGDTNLASAFNLISEEGKKYDRIFILSDNECNVGRQKDAYKSYVRTVANPYIYSIDLAAYGTKPLNSDRVNYYFGYGYAMFDDIERKEFNPSAVIDEIRKVEI